MRVDTHWGRGPVSTALTLYFRIPYQCVLPGIRVHAAIDDARADGKYHVVLHKVAGLGHPPVGMADIWRPHTAFVFN